VTRTTESGVAKSGWDPADKLDRFVGELKHAMGASLESVVLFGSIPRGEAREGVSDVNLLLLMKRADRATLLEGAPVAQRWREEVGGVPLLFTPDEWRRSADVFPVEVADMQEHHRVLHGRDPLPEMRVGLGHLRLQVEREVRGKLAQMRRGLFLAANSPADLGRMLLGTAPSVAAYLRAVLRLVREPVPADTAAVARAAAARVGASADGFLEVWGARESPESFVPGEACTDGVIELVLAIASYVDTLEGR
jgi:predicted nucleotidyltransferase